MRRYFAVSRSAKMAGSLRTTSLFLIILCAGHGAFAENWPMFRHDRELTSATEERISPPLERIWVFRSRQSQYAPMLKGDYATEFTPEQNRCELDISAAGDSIFFTSEADGRIVCLDAANAKVRWEFLAGSSVNRPPTWFHGRIYAGSDDGHVYCLDAGTGRCEWTYKAAPANRWMFSYNQLTSVWPIRTNVLVDAVPSLHGGRAVAYLGAGIFPHDGTFAIGLDADTGKIVWKNDADSETLHPLTLSPNGNIYAPAGRRLYMPNDVNGFSTLRAISPSNGRPWSTRSRHGKVHMFVGKGDDKRYIGNGAPSGVTRRGETLTSWSVKTPDYTLDTGSIQGATPARRAFLMYNPDLCSVISTPGVIYSIRRGGDGNKGIAGKVFAHDAKDNTELWCAEIGEWPNQVIAANGRLFVSTRSGTIYAYGPKNSKKHGVINEPVDANPFGGGPSFAAAVKAIIAQTAVREGYGLVLDCDTGALAFELAKRTHLNLVAVFADAEKGKAAREAVSRANLHVSRILVWHRQPREVLPFPPRFADLIVSESAVLGGPLPSDRDALARLLKPIRGQAMVGGRQSAAALERWVAGLGQNAWAVAGTNGSHWARRTGPRLKEAGGWSHVQGDAGNTMCSNDGVLKPPLGVVWVGRPFSTYGSRGVSPAILMDGVLVHQTVTPDNKIGYAEGFDQYTGRRLWRRVTDAPVTVGAHGAIFARHLEHVTQLDPWSGKEVKKYVPPHPPGNWTKMSADRNGRTLYLHASWEGGSVLALAIPAGTVLWKVGGPGKKAWGAWSAISDGRIYFVGGRPTEEERAEAAADMLGWLKTLPGEDYRTLAAQIDKHSFTLLKALDAKTGKTLYRKAVDTTNAGGDWTRKPPPRGYRGSTQDACVMANGGAVVFFTGSGTDKGWRVWPHGGYRGRALSVYDGATGKLLWYKFANYRARPVATADFIYAEPWGFHLRTGEQKTRLHPITGETAIWAFDRYGHHCGTFNASRHLIFGRSNGICYHDGIADQGLYTFLRSRPTCWIDTSSGGGTMIKPPHAITQCKCLISMPFTVALAQVHTPLTMPQVFAQPGPFLPVKHLYLDFGATGDRRDAKARLWLTPKRVYSMLASPGRTDTLLLKYEAKTDFYEGGGDTRRSAMYTPVGNTDVPFVFASAARGLKHCIIPIAEGGSATRAYSVRLGFCALPGDKPGQRVFDVKLNGKIVLKNFDILKETGRPDMALWKEFKMSLGKELTLELVARSADPTTDQMPLLNAVVVLRK